MAYELFISYSRKDNIPRPLPPHPQAVPAEPPAKGWVTALYDEILADHRRFSTEPLHIFFDTREIRDMDDWRHRILTSLRESRILLVCLSPDYFASDYCRWEFEEYVQRQVHQLMGFDSFAEVYFVEVPGVSEQDMAQGWYELLRRKNYTDLRPWFPLGAEALRQAAVRERLAALGTSLYQRIQRARRATSVPGNLRRLNPHFIGRQTELRQLHENLALGAIGVVTAVHGLGGQGKTELATAYAHGWADSYPAGLWVLGAEGRKDILPLLGELCAELAIPLSTGPDETAEARGRRVLAELKRRALAVKDTDPDKGAATLVLLDNVSEPALLAQPQLALIPQEDWLRVIATTREGPEKFPASRQQSLAFIAVDALTVEDAARLIEDHQIETGGHWPAATAAADTAAARQIARELGGFTLAVESVAIYLGLHPDIRPAAYLARLRAEGLTGVDALPADADVAAQMQHREKQLRLVLDQTLTRLTPPERTALDYAALLPPESIPWPWLRELVALEHPDAFATAPGHPDPWPALRRRLEGLRLLTPGDHVEIARLHRMVAAHVRERLAAGDAPEGQRPGHTPAQGHALGSPAPQIPSPERAAQSPDVTPLQGLGESGAAVPGALPQAGMARPVGAERLRRLRDKVEDFALALQEDILHDPAAHVWLVAPMQEAVRHWSGGGQDTALGHIAGVVGTIEATLGRLDVAETFLRVCHEVLERLLQANPDSAQAARDVWVSCWKMADFAEQTGNGDAMRWWRKAFEILDGMKRAGRFITPQDEGFLEQLRRKARP